MVRERDIKLSNNGEYRAITRGNREVVLTSSFGLMQKKIHMNAYGLDTSGKTRFPLTGPELIGYIPLDRKTRLTVEKNSKELGKKFLIPKDDFIREVNPLKLSAWDEKTIRTHYSDHLNRVDDAIYAMHAHPDVQVICIDLFSQYYQDCLYSSYGREMSRTIRIGSDLKKDRNEANQHVIDLINAISDKHLILTHKIRDEWIDNKPTGRTTNDGFRDVGYHCNVTAEFVNNHKWNPKVDTDDSNWHYGMAVRRCQAMPEIEQGGRKEMTLTDDGINFLNLAALMWPDEDLEQFA